MQKKSGPTSKVNDISVFEYLDNAIDTECVVVDPDKGSGVTTATLIHKFSTATCAASSGTSWRVGSGSGAGIPSSERNNPCDSSGIFDVEWVMITGVGLLVTFTLADAGGDGKIRTLFGGQNDWYDFGNAVNGCLSNSSGHLQIRAHEVVSPINGVDCNLSEFVLSWDHVLDTSGGNINIDTANGKTTIQHGKTFNNAGNAATNCGQITNAFPSSQVRIFTLEQHSTL